MGDESVNKLLYKVHDMYFERYDFTYIGLLFLTKLNIRFLNGGRRKTDTYQY